MTLIQRLTFALVLIVAVAVSSHSAVARSLQPGETFRDCQNCPRMVVVPAGLFIMGLGGKLPKEGPPHRVFIKKPFAIGVYEVTFDEWDACRADGACTKNPDDHTWGRGKRPVINVTIADVDQYLKWLSAKTGKTYRLPSEAEWEYANRAGTTTFYPWGDDVGVNKANCKDCGSEWSAHSTAPVGSFAPNAWGLYDTVANAYEWTADCWNPTHDGAPVDGSARTDGDCSQRVMKGGSFYYYKKVSRSSYRAKNPVNVNSYWLGFRVVRNL